MSRIVEALRIFTWLVLIGTVCLIAMPAALLWRFLEGPEVRR